MMESDLVKRLKLLKRINHLTNQGLARRAGLTLSNVSKLLSGVTCQPKSGTLIKLSAALNVSIDYMLTGQSPPNQAKNPEEYKILYVYRQMNDTQKTALCKELGIKK